MTSTSPRPWLSPDADHSSRHTKRLHAARVERQLRKPDVVADADAPPPDATPELAAAWRSLSLQWMTEYPDYRDEIKQRVSDAAKHADARARKIEVSQRTLDGGRLSEALAAVNERDDQLERLTGY